MIALLLTGAADAVSTIIRNTIRQLQTPDHIRGRMTSVNQIFFQGGPQLGEIEAGAGRCCIWCAVCGHQRRDWLYYRYLGLSSGNGRS